MDEISQGIITMRHTLRLAVCLTLFAALGTALLEEARADETAFNQFDAAAKIAGLVQKIAPDQKQIFVREFRGTGSSHVGLSKLVGDELGKAGYTIKPGARTEVEGRLKRLPRALDKPLIGFTADCNIVFPDGKERGFVVNVENSDEGHTITGKTGEVAPPPDAGPDALPQTFPVIKGARIFPSPRSPYSIEVLVETAPDRYKELIPTLDEGTIHVDLNKGDIYAVRLYNTSDYEAAVTVSIDGLSRFALSDDENRRNGRDLVSTEKPRLVKGYFRDDKVVDSFQVGEYSKSVAAKVLPAGKDVGLITVTFAAAWNKGDPEPDDEPVAKSFPVGTVRGPERKDPTVRVQREIGKVRAVIKVRY